MMIDMIMMYQKEKHDFNFRYIGDFNVLKFKKGLEQITDYDWQEYDFRQREFPVHRKTETIPLLYDESFSDYPQKWKHFSKFENAISDLSIFLSEFYNKGKIVRCILTKLKKNSVIPQHVDSGESLMTCYRHHIAVITNELVYFRIGNEKKHLSENQVWEINNSRIHSVENNSDIDRIHIIVDWNTSY